nr:MAG TPA: hypothetical protein [Caudoviricetes sp.]
MNMYITGVKSNYVRIFCLNIFGNLSVYFGYTWKSVYKKFWK